MAQQLQLLHQQIQTSQLEKRWAYNHAIVTMVLVHRELLQRLLAIQDRPPQVKKHASGSKTARTKSPVSPSCTKHVAKSSAAASKTPKSSGVTTARASGLKGIPKSAATKMKSPSPLSPKGLSHTITPNDLFSSTSDVSDSDVDSDVAVTTNVAKVKEEQKEGKDLWRVHARISFIGRRKRIRRLQPIQTKDDGASPFLNIEMLRLCLGSPVFPIRIGGLQVLSLGKVLE